MTRSRLAQEVTAFLGGHHLEVTRATRGERAVEPWMWLNAAGHRRLRELADLASATPLDAESDTFDWADARGLICAELVRRAGGDEDLLTFIQTEHVVPLELELVGKPGLTPWSLAQLTLAVLSRTSEV